MGTSMLAAGCPDGRVEVTTSSPPPWSRVEGKSYTNLPQMPPDSGGICMGVDLGNHRFAPELLLGWVDDGHVDAGGRMP